MIGEELFQFIHALDKRQKAFFTKTTLRNKAADSDYFLLYRAIESAESYDEKHIRSTNAFLKSQKFNNARRKLAGKIMDSLVAASEDRIPFQNYVLIALRKGATSLAKKKISEEIQTAQQKNDWNYLHYIKRFVHEIHCATGIQLNGGKKQHLEHDIESIVSDTQKLRKLLFGLRDVALLPETNTALQLKRISQEIDSFPPSQGLNGYLILKAKAVLERILNGHASAQIIFKEVVAYLETTSFPLRQGYLLKELSLLAILNSHLGNLEEALATILKLSTIAPDDPTFEHRKRRLMCKVQLSPSVSQISLDIPQKGFAILQTHSHLFSKLEGAALQLSYGIVLLVHGKLGTCKTILRELRNSPKADWKPIEWTVELLYFLALHGSDAYAASEIQLRRLRKLAKNQPLSIPPILCQFLNKLSFSSKAELKTLWESTHRQIHPFLDYHQERLVYERINFPAWIESVLSGQDLSQLYFQHPPAAGRNALHFG